MTSRTWVSDDGRITLINDDCRNVIPHIKADAVITDPPYGMNWDADMTRFTGGSGGHTPRGKRHNKIKGDDTPFDPAPLLDFQKVILFGCNHFAQRLPVGTTLVWIKRNDAAFGTFLSDAELAWMKGGHGVYCFRDMTHYATNGATARAHVTQKPVPLMKWCMDVAKVPLDAVVFDPYAGSGTTVIACIRTGRRAIAVELDEGYFNIMVERVKRELAQPMIPGMEPQKHEQGVLI